MTHLGHGGPLCRAPLLTALVLLGLCRSTQQHALVIPRFAPRRARGGLFTHLVDESVSHYHTPSRELMAHTLTLVDDDDDDHHHLQHSSIVPTEAGCPIFLSTCHEREALEK